MKLNKQVQYGILFALHLAKVGKSNLQSAADSLGLSIRFLEQVARKLRINGVVKSIRGPGGGYKLADDASMRDVMYSLIESQFLSTDEFLDLSRGSSEHKALAQHAINMSLSLFNVMNRKVDSVMREILVNQEASLDRLDMRN